MNLVVPEQICVAGGTNSIIFLAVFVLQHKPVVLQIKFRRVGKFLALGTARQRLQLGGAALLVDAADQPVMPDVVFQRAPHAGIVGGQAGITSAPQIAHGADDIVLRHRPFMLRKVFGDIDNRRNHPAGGGGLQFATRTAQGGDGGVQAAEIAFDFLSLSFQ